MQISADFDSGNIETLQSNISTECNLNIRKDSHSDEKQWFYFKAQGVKGEICTYNIRNAGEASYPEAWETSSIVASYDQKEWFRIPIDYDGQTLTFYYKSLHNEIYFALFALFAPYELARHRQLIEHSIKNDNCNILDTCRTVNNNLIELLQIGSNNSDNKKVWVVARQHPAETMSEWFAEGLITSLLNNDNLVASYLLESTTFYIVTNMNPDGSIAGNLRTNAAGVDLNRSWLSPDINRSPETYFIKNKMLEIGVDLFLDIHGDEEIPYAFIAGAEGNPSYTAKIAKQDKKFRVDFNKASDDFCIKDGYEKYLPNEGDLNIACNQVGELFNCLSLTIEMPFTDNMYKPDKILGWSSKRSFDLGKAVLFPIKQFINDNL